MVGQAATCVLCLLGWHVQVTVSFWIAFCMAWRSTGVKHGLQAAELGTTAALVARRKHHVVYDDGEEGLVDLATARFRFLPAASRAAPAAELPAEAAAEGRGSASAAGQGEALAPLEFTSAADAGEELHVWWPKERVWYLGTVTHVLQNG